MERRVCGEEKGKTRPFSQKARRCTRLANRYKASHDLPSLSISLWRAYDRQAAFLLPFNLDIEQKP